MALLFGGSVLIILVVAAGMWFLRHGPERMPGFVIRYSPFVDHVTQAYFVAFSQRPAGVEADFLVNMAHHFPLERYEALVGPPSAAGLRAAVMVHLRTRGSPSVPVDTQAIAVIRRWSTDQRWWVRQQWMIWFYPSHPDIIAVMATLLADPHPQVAHAAAIGLAGPYERPFPASDHLIAALIRAMDYQIGFPDDQVPSLAPIVRDVGYIPGEIRLTEWVTLQGYSPALMSKSEVEKHEMGVRSSAFGALVKWDSEKAEKTFIERSRSWSDEKRDSYFKLFHSADYLPLQAIQIMSESANDEMVRFIVNMLMNRLFYPGSVFRVRDPTAVEKELYWRALADLVREPRYASMWARLTTEALHTYKKATVEAAFECLPADAAQILWLALDERNRPGFQSQLQAPRELPTP